MKTPTQDLNEWANRVQSYGEAIDFIKKIQRYNSSNQKEHNILCISTR